MRRPDDRQEQRAGEAPLSRVSLAMYVAALIVWLLGLFLLDGGYTR